MEGRTGSVTVATRYATRQLIKAPSLRLRHDELRASRP